MALPLVVPGSVGGSRGAPARFTPQVEATTDQSRSMLVFTEKLGDVADTEQQLSRMARITESQSVFQNDLDRKRIELQSDPDIEGREKKFQTYSQERYAQLSDGMDGKTREFFKRTVNPMADSMSTTVRHQARTDLVEKHVVGLRTTNDALATKAVDAKSPNERQAYIDTINANIQEAFDKGWLSDAGFEKERKDTLVKVDQATALKAIRENPGQAAVMLASGKLASLDPVQREKLIDAANTESRQRLAQALAIEARNERAEAKIAAGVTDRATKEMMSKTSDNTLTREWLEMARPHLKPDDYNAGLKVLKGGAAVDSKDAMAALLPKLDREDISKSLLDYLQKNEITKDTYVSLLEKNRQALKDDGPPSPYKQGYSYVNDFLAPALMFDAASAKIANAGRAAALLEYNVFADANRDAIKANPILATQQAQDIVRRYQLINFDQIGLAVGLPEGYAGTRDNISAQDIKAAGVRILQLFDKGAVTEAQKTFELRRLDQWDEIIKRRDAANAEKPGPQGKPSVGSGDGRR
jgi:hypothetical protein